jgi:hypothetical protein
MTSTPPAEPSGPRPADPPQPLPPQEYPSAAPEYQNAAPASRPGQFDPQSVDVKDWMILGTGVLAFVFSFPSYYVGKATSKITGKGCPALSASAVRGSESAWHGFFGWFAALVAVLAAILLALHLFGPRMAIPIRLVVFGGFALALFSVIVAFFIHPGTGQGSSRSGQIGSCTLTFESHIGHGFGYWASVIVIAVGAAVAYLQLRDSGEAVPWGEQAEKA